MAPRSKLAMAGIGAALAAGVAVWAFPASDAEKVKPPLGLFTSLPIYWGESESVGEMLDAKMAPHWARTALERDNRLLPLDTLEAAELAGLDRLVMAQPRPLAPAENVALDDWVRGGGRLLLFADPLLTEHSRFALGDRRRPQDVVLLSPILRRWGLELEFDEDPSHGERTVNVAGKAVPVEYPGRLRAIAGSAPSCIIESESVVARCRIGRGSAVVVADAAVLETNREPELGAEALQALVGAAFDD